MQKPKNLKEISQRKLTLSYKAFSKVYNSIDETIGNTPMVFLKRLKKHLHYDGNIIAKLESFNPLGSVKDRIGLAMIRSAEEKKMCFHYNYRTYKRKYWDSASIHLCGSRLQINSDNA